MSAFNSSSSGGNGGGFTLGSGASTGTFLGGAGGFGALNNWPTAAWVILVAASVVFVAFTLYQIVKRHRKHRLGVR